VANEPKRLMISNIGNGRNISVGPLLCAAHVEPFPANGVRHLFLARSLLTGMVFSQGLLAYFVPIVERGAKAAFTVELGLVEVVG